MDGRIVVARRILISTMETVSSGFGENQFIDARPFSGCMWEWSAIVTNGIRLYTIFQIVRATRASTLFRVDETV